MMPKDGCRTSAKEVDHHLLIVLVKGLLCWWQMMSCSFCAETWFSPTERKADRCNYKLFKRTRLLGCITQRLWEELVLYCTYPVAFDMMNQATLSSAGSGGSIIVVLTPLTAIIAPQQYTFNNRRHFSNL